MNRPHVRQHVAERVPVLAWLFAPGALLPLCLLFSRSAGVIVVLLAALAAMAGSTLLVLGTGWLSPSELTRVSLRQLRARRQLLVQQQHVLRAAVTQLSRATVDSRRATTRLVAELVRAEESVRAHLAGELHDTVAQTLSMALMALGDVEAPRHREGRESVRDAEEQLRAVLARIRPPELASGSLAAAIGELCLELEHRYGTCVDVRWQDAPMRLSPAMATLAYRVMQESLMNGVEHADGQGLALDLSVLRTATDLRMLRVVISDTGPGFDPRGVVSVGGRHVGLKIARERAEIAGGSLVVQSAPGEGTRIVLELPLGPDLDVVSGGRGAPRASALAS
ncbi:MAG: sensor histidine kinase [Mycobacteriales bacterium]